MSAEDWNGKSNASLMNGLYLSDTERKYGALDEIEIDQIIPCKNHTFKVVDDAKMMELVDSIRDHGVSEPGVAFVNEDGQLEMLAGHRRKRACEILGLPTMPIIVKNITRDEATILMGESNLASREDILPSEKAFTYKEMYEAMKRQGKRADLTSSPMGTKSRSDDELAKKVGESRNQIQRYMRLTELNSDLLNLVDMGYMAIRPAVEISHINSVNQKLVYEYFKETALYNEADEIVNRGTLPSLSQAQTLRELDKAGALDEDSLLGVMEKDKPNQRPKLSLPLERVEKFKGSLSRVQFEEKVIKALEMYEKYLEKEKTGKERIL